MCGVGRLQMLTVAVHRPDGGDSDRGRLGGVESTDCRLQEPEIERSTFMQSHFNIIHNCKICA